MCFDTVLSNFPILSQIAIMINFDLASEIQKLADNTNFRVLKAIKRYKLKTSTDEGLNISINRTGQLNYTIVFDFRASLQWQDMGAGAGYHKGVRINQAAYSAITEPQKFRKQKRLTNRKIFWFINSLKEVGTINIMDQTVNSFTVNLTTPNVRTHHNNN